MSETSPRNRHSAKRLKRKASSTPGGLNDADYAFGTAYIRDHKRPKREVSSSSPAEDATPARREIEGIYLDILASKGSETELFQQAVKDVVESVVESDLGHGTLHQVIYTLEERDTDTDSDKLEEIRGALSALWHARVAKAVACSIRTEAEQRSLIAAVFTELPFSLHGVEELYHKSLRNGDNSSSDEAGRLSSPLREITEEPPFPKINVAGEEANVAPPQRPTKESHAQAAAPPEEASEKETCQNRGPKLVTPQDVLLHYMRSWVVLNTERRCDDTAVTQKAKDVFSTFDLKQKQAWRAICARLTTGNSTVEEEALAAKALLEHQNVPRRVLEPQDLPASTRPMVAEEQSKEPPTKHRATRKTPEDDPPPKASPKKDPPAKDDGEARILTSVPRNRDRRFRSKFVEWIHPFVRNTTFRVGFFIDVPDASTPVRIHFDRSGFFSACRDALKSRNLTPTKVEHWGEQLLVAVFETRSAAHRALGCVVTWLRVQLRATFLPASPPRYFTADLARHPGIPKHEVVARLANAFAWVIAKTGAKGGHPTVYLREGDGTQRWIVVLPHDTTLELLRFYVPMQSHEGADDVEQVLFKPLPPQKNGTGDRRNAEMGRVVPLPSVDP